MADFDAQYALGQSRRAASDERADDNRRAIRYGGGGVLGRPEVHPTRAVEDAVAAGDWAYRLTERVEVLGDDGAWAAASVVRRETDDAGGQTYTCRLQSSGLTAVVSTDLLRARQLVPREGGVVVPSLVVLATRAYQAGRGEPQQRSEQFEALSGLVDPKNAQFHALALSTAVCARRAEREALDTVTLGTWSGDGDSDR